jgi:hypothetical protein
MMPDDFDTPPRRIKHSERIEAARYRVVRHDGAVLGGFSPLERARQALAVIVRDDMPKGYAHIVSRGGEVCL